ncbi:MAG: gliding motility lipoprotein GldB [Bacteroidetes bacterium HGW-Bacteroidetes-2]|nr:MAG: gliding motility lipoprotein GldB [Bacteroidetes bacterium HGW-Bacteroidetes-2]
MKYLFYLLFLLFLLFSCTSDKKINPEIERIPVHVVVERFDEKFAAATPESLQELKMEFPYLFPEKYADSIWEMKMKDTLQIELQTEVHKVFVNFSAIEEEIKSLFQHLKYYFPLFQEPKIVAVISDVDYRNKIVVTDSLLIIGLDNFLGKEHYFYTDIPQYLSKNFTQEQLTPNIAEAYAERIVPIPTSKTFLEALVYFGKINYLKETLLPFFEENRILGYTEAELQWAKENESEIWRYFVEKELLYSSDPQLGPRFINPAPFSKFYLELDNESPGRLGQYMGWQIVRSYAKNNTISLQQLLKTNAEDLFNNSKFKPRK